MRFDDSILKIAEDDPITAIVEICRIVDKYTEECGTQEWRDEDLHLFIEAVALIGIILETHNIDSELYVPDINGNVDNSCGSLFQYIANIRTEFQAKESIQKLEIYKQKYRIALKSKLTYEFSQGDLERIQELLNELRTQIASTEQLSLEHQQRLLKRLEKLQSELHKRVSDLDRFWGIVGDAGVVLGKLGSDAKPIVDRLKEISEIVWRTQARTEELPSNMSNPLLENENT
jgi:hypothetical protein